MNPKKLEDLSRILRGASIVASKLAEQTSAKGQVSLDSYRRAFESALGSVYQATKGSRAAEQPQAGPSSHTPPQPPPAPRSDPTGPTGTAGRDAAAASASLIVPEARPVEVMRPAAPPQDSLVQAAPAAPPAPPPPAAGPRGLAASAAADSISSTPSSSAGKTTATGAMDSAAEKKEEAGAARGGAGSAPRGHRTLRERKVPSTPLQRVMGFGGLAASLAFGTVQETAKRALGLADTPPAGAGKGYSAVLSEANAERIAEALCRMRGAALKIGQMISIQDDSVIPPQVQAALERVRQGADVMPKGQLEAQLVAELGPTWRDRVAEFDPEPMAAASIGQVHRARLHDGREVAMKIQYPGVAESIESDVDNLMRMLKYFNVFPKGMYLDAAAKVAKKELALECDYEYERRSQDRFRALVKAEPSLQGRFDVPATVPELCSKRVLASVLVPGVAIDKLANMDQKLRDEVGTRLLELTLRELFQWRFMQTDPNWGNFLYDSDQQIMYLIDFGAAKGYPKGFVDDYLRMVRACAERDRGEVVHRSLKLGFLTGDESQVMLDAHTEAGFVVGMPFATDGKYDFGLHGTMTSRVTELGSTMLRHRLTPPPEEAYSLHRRLSGAFLACIKLRARVPCREMFLRVFDGYKFGPVPGEDEVGDWGASAAQGAEGAGPGAAAQT